MMSVRSEKSRGTDENARHLVNPPPLHTHPQTHRGLCVSIQTAIGIQAANRIPFANSVETISPQGAFEAARLPI